MLTSASSEKHETLPRNRSLMRGCVRPHRLAAYCCVQPLDAIIALNLSIKTKRACVLAVAGGVSSVVGRLGDVIPT